MGFDVVRCRRGKRMDEYYPDKKSQGSHLLIYPFTCFPSIFRRRWEKRPGEIKRRKKKITKIPFTYSPIHPFTCSPVYHRFSAADGQGGRAK
jgi:hypothetical protein